MKMNAVKFLDIARVSEGRTRNVVQPVSYSSTPASLSLSP